MLKEMLKKTPFQSYMNEQGDLVVKVDICLNSKIEMTQDDVLKWEFYRRDTEDWLHNRGRYAIRERNKG